MTAAELWELRNSNEAPFNHEQYTIWLHNQIIDKINYDIWKYREMGPAKQDGKSYATCTNIMALPALKKAYI